MANYITVDGGTTNTRVSLVLNGKIFGTKKLSLGARKGIDDKNLQRTALREAISEFLTEASLSPCDVERVIASGMITSEFGLIKLDHVIAPAGIEQLHESMHETVLEDITDIPFAFIRGVKILDNGFENTDLMRGEETEIIGLQPDKNSVVILPGSHSKIILTDSDERISQFSTMLTGEMIYALSQDTILKDAVDLSVSEIDEEYLICGYHYAISEGLNKALFKVRILKNVFAAEKAKTYSFFLGAVLSDEIQSVLRLSPKQIFIGGKSQIKQAMSTIFKNESDINLTLYDNSTVDESVISGAIKIFEFRK